VSDEFAKMSGLTKLLGIEIIEAKEGRAVTTATPTEAVYNHQGRVHGGFAATLIDTAMGIAVHTRVSQGTGYGTIELKVNYVRKIDAASGLLTCIGTVLHAGRTMLTAEAKVTDASGKICAHGSGTFLVYPT
jgi:acyl-CoA thioesterase